MKSLRHNVFLKCFVDTFVYFIQGNYEESVYLQ